MEECVAAHSRAKSTLTAFLAKKKSTHVSFFVSLSHSLSPFQSFSAFLIPVYTLISRQLISSFSPAGGFSFLSHIRIQGSELEMSDHPLLLTLMQKARQLY